jgi:hypothetical protein
MKFAFYTTLIIGIVNLVFQCLLIIGFMVTDNFFDGDMTARFFEGLFLVIFGICGILLVVSAIKIKQGMKFREETEGFLSGTQSFEQLNA